MAAIHQVSPATLFLIQGMGQADYPGMLRLQLRFISVSGRVLQSCMLSDWASLLAGQHSVLTASAGATGAGWGNGFVTNSSLIKQYRLSDANVFSQALTDMPFLNNVIIR